MTGRIATGLAGLALAGCGGGGEVTATVTVTQPATVTETATDTEPAPPETACSTSGLRIVLPQVADLPAAVAETRRRIFAAALACDYDTLQTIALEGEPGYLGWQSLLGTTMGSPRDFAGLLRLLEGASWRPVLDSVRPLAEAESALSRLESGQHFGKLVLGL